MEENAEELRREAGHAAVERFVKSGMTLGLGTGKTTAWVVRRIGELLSSGELSDIRGVPTSERTARLAGEVGVPLLTLAEARPDLTIDGADEVTRALEVIKGRGGALLREKIVASASREGLVLVVDESKCVDSLGVGTLPVEVEPFGAEATLKDLASLGCEAQFRMDGEERFITDGGHLTADLVFPDGVDDAAALEVEIKNIPGALECGLFVGLAVAAVISTPDGRLEVVERQS